MTASELWPGVIFRSVLSGLRVIPNLPFAACFNVRNEVIRQAPLLNHLRRFIQRSHLPHRDATGAGGIVTRAARRQCCTRPQHTNVKQTPPAPI